MKKFFFLSLLFGSLLLSKSVSLAKDAPPPSRERAIAPSFISQDTLETLKELQKDKPRVLIADITFGETVPVGEVDLATLLTRRIREAQHMGLFKEKREEAKKLLGRHAARPAELAYPVATEKREWTFTLLKKEDLEKVNPNLRSALLSEARAYAFFDADSPEQTRWALSLAGAFEGARLRLVSVRGDRLSFEKKTGLTLYSDQGGVLTRRFRVSEIPALVRITALGGSGFTIPMTGDAP